LAASYRLRHQLHATALNTRHRKAEAPAGKKAKHRRFANRTPVDAGPLLEAYAEHELGTVRIEGVHLSRLAALGPDGYYPSDAFVSFP